MNTPTRPYSSWITRNSEVMQMQTMLQCPKRRRANLRPEAIRHFVFTFLSAPFSLGHERGEVAWSRRLASALWERPMLSGEEPRKQKTRMPERKGITRAVSPKKIRKRKKANVQTQERRREGGPENGSDRFGSYDPHRIGKSPMIARGTVSGDHFRIGDHPGSAR